MFPFQKSGEISFKIDNNNEDNDSYEIKIEDLEDRDLFGTSIINQDQSRGRGRGRGRGRKTRSVASSSNPSNNINNYDDEEEKRRAFHRDNERKRRQEMATLFESLNSVIPADNLKGRKSITNHLEEATKYIKNLEKNVKELGETRDRLKQELDGSSSHSTPPYGVVIRQFTGGLDIEIRVKDEEFMLSTFLQVAFEEGLHLISSTSTKLHGRFIHSIKCEVSDIISVDLNRLQERLNNLLC